MFSRLEKKALKEERNIHTILHSACISLLLLLSHFSRVRLCATPETAAHQAPLPLGFSRQECYYDPNEQLSLRAAITECVC